MSKRKASNNVDAPPAQRAAIDAPAAAAAAHAEEDEAAALQRARLSIPRAARSFRLAELLYSNRPIDQKLASVAAMIENDATGGEPLIDLSMQVESQDRGTLLMQLIDVLKKTNEKESDADSVKRQKRAALSHLTPGGVWLHIARLMQTYDVNARRGGRATLQIVTEAGVPVDERDWPFRLARLLQSYDLQARRDSRNALHVIADSGVPVDRRDWPYRLARLLLWRGEDVNAVSVSGLTPVHQWAWNDYDADDRACGLQLLLEHGADPNLQDADGDTPLHILVYHANEGPLRHLTESRLLDRADLFAFNKKGKTPLSVAWLREAEKLEDAARKSIHGFLATLVQGCRRDLGAFVLARVKSHLIPDLAFMVADFLFGGA